MKHRIALLADVHGNASALKAVAEDAIKEGVTDSWFLGDLIMPGPGANELFETLKSMNVSVYVKGNWEDCFLDVLNKEIDLDNPTDIYISRLVQYQCEHLDTKNIDRIKNLPLQITKNINDVSISLTHHLQEKNYGADLRPTNNQEAFDQLFDQDYDISIYGHTHQQLYRYSSAGQLIINPGSVGQPHYKWEKLRTDIRAQYAILEIDEAGIGDVRFRKIPYDIDNEFKNAQHFHLPYSELYQAMYETGIAYTHNHEFLQEINDRFSYKEEMMNYIREHFWK